MTGFPYPSPEFARDEALVELSKILRCEILCMTHRAGSGHPGGSLSAVEILSLLYLSELRHDPANPGRPDRDRFVLSKGHACPILYALLAYCGYFPPEELCHLREVGHMLQGHPSIHTPGVEASTGSLGQGLSIANGMALAARLDDRDTRVWCLMGDGELDEGQCWEAAMTAAHYGLDNLVAVVDRNRLQIDGDTEKVMALEPLTDKWTAFGFHVVNCDGHSFPDLRRAYAEARETKGKPTCIIAHTHKGRGVSFMTDVAGWHGRAPDDEELRRAIGEVCGCAPETEDCCLKLARGGGR